MSDLLLPLGPSNSGDRELPPLLRHVGEQLYQQAWTAYREVGCPYGETDEAMRVWYTLYGQRDGPSPAVGRN